MWFQIGSDSLKLHKYLVGKWAFEESLRLCCDYWPSLDALVVLLFAIGDYASCLKHLFDALRADRFYAHGIVIMMRLLEFDDEYYANAVKNFINNN